MDLTPEERRRGVEEAFASLRLDGLKPTAAALRDAEDYIQGRRTLEEIITDVVRRHTADSSPAPVNRAFDMGCG